MILGESHIYVESVDDRTKTLEVQICPEETSFWQVHWPIWCFPQIHIILECKFIVY